jgi:hypothetical protein
MNAVSTDLLGGIGNFTDANAWTVPSGWSLSSNIATGSAVTAYLLPASNGILTHGKRYAVTVTQSSYTSGNLYLYMGTGAPGSGNHYNGLPAAVGTYTFILNAYNSNFGIYGANYTGVIDNVTVSLAEPDRTENKSGLQVFGTVTKTAVATGAELVGYSGFSTSNYLEQPYNSALDFGTGNFSIAVWVKPVASTAVQLILHRRKLDATGTPIEFGINSDETPYLYTGGGTTPLTGKPIPVDQWAHVVAVRKGGFYGIYVNGKLFNSNTGQNVDNIVNADAHTLIGGYITNGSRTYGWQGSMALLRVSSTAPSAEQIKKMYNDEKHLFQPNAKAALYGTSDAVTALAYDDDTELLHVGTSAGRSVFQGLNRVDNTTDAVTTAISASNGFIVEE